MSEAELASGRSAETASEFGWTDALQGAGVQNGRRRIGQIRLDIVPLLGQVILGQDKLCLAHEYNPLSSSRLVEVVRL